MGELGMYKNYGYELWGCLLKSVFILSIDLKDILILLVSIIESYKNLKSN